MQSRISISKKKTYISSDYTNWLDLIIENGHSFKCLAISGGEPFILGDKLNKFCSEIREKYEKQHIELFSNAFWMTSEIEIAKYHTALSSINNLQLSFYPDYIEKIGWQKLQDLKNYIKNKYNITVGTFQQNGVKNFGQVYFFENPIEKNKNSQCPVKYCTQLRSDGYLYRCPYGYYLNTAIVSYGFNNGKDILFNLQEIKTKSIQDWYEKWPLDNCRYCGCGNASNSKWQSDNSIKDMNRSQYLTKISNLIGKNKMKIKKIF